MKLNLNLNAKSHSDAEVVVIAAWSKPDKNSKNILSNSHWPKEYKDTLASLKAAASFDGSAGKSHVFNVATTTVLAVGLGEKTKFDFEQLRKTAANLYKKTSSGHKSLAVNLDSFVAKNKLEESLSAFTEGLLMSAYTYDRFKSKKSEAKLSVVTLDSKVAKTKAKKLNKILEDTISLVESINFGRDLVNCPPNVLNSETYAKEIEKDVKNLKRVKYKVLGKAELKKHKMGMFLSVNAGSNFEPRLVHLTYSPAKATKKTKHIALVGKGLTFDTGGYSLKPGGSMVNMKYDMAGSATMYAAFRAAVLTNANCKISCFLGMTDNAVNEKATMPDSIVTAKNGKTVEILNTDAEGRLVLGDVLTYASEQDPDAIIDAATLTGACLVALGIEVCAIMGNNQKLTDSLLKSAKATDEYLWQLPLIPEWTDDMKSNIADLKNIGGSRFGGTAKAAAFLEQFVGEGIAWAHLDIAGIGDSQGGHKSYCPTKGASGLMVRSLTHFLHNAK